MVSKPISARVLPACLRSVLVVELRESKVCAYPTSTTSHKKHDLLLKSDNAQLLCDSLRTVF